MDRELAITNISPEPAPKSVWDSFAQILKAVGLYEAAWRENRRHDRRQKRWDKHNSWRRSGMACNGERERSRRRRQIAAGSLRVENGLGRG